MILGRRAHLTALVTTPVHWTTDRAQTYPDNRFNHSEFKPLVLGAAGMPAFPYGRDRVRNRVWR
jgi:hypothetical protein